MNVTRIQKFSVVVAASAFLLAATSLFAQTHRPTSPSSRNNGQISHPNGQLPSHTLFAPRMGGVPTLASFDGIDFNGSNCGCLPPDTNAAVGNGFVVETVNIQIRIFDMNGNVLLDEPLQTFFGSFSGGDPYVVYDDTVNRWFVNAFDSFDTGLFLAVSNDSNPLHGFRVFDLTNVGGFPDYAKPGYTKDAYFLVFNNFGPNGDAGATVAAIDKTALLNGNLRYFVYESPEFQFRAMPPAQMHGDTTGGTEWFISTDGTDAGGNAIRVVKLTNYLSNSPNFTFYRFNVPQYSSATTADQPGGPGTVTTFPNTTFTQVHSRLGRIMSAMASAQAQDGFVYPKGLYWEFLVKNQPSPLMMRSGIIDAGPGVAEQMPSIDEDSAGNLGFTWIESSLNEFLSMWVGSRYTVDTNNATHGTQTAPGGGFFVFSFRIGDYSTTTEDPADPTSFWSANEYIGSDGGNDIWLTHLTHFRAR